MTIKRRGRGGKGGEREEERGGKGVPWTKTFPILGLEGVGQGEGRYRSQARSDPLLLRPPVAMLHSG